MSRELTPEEREVIENRATEPPFSGRYEEHFAPGFYLCRRCGRALYSSESKFDSGCGWPAFATELPESVLRRPDPDGARTEICCRFCQAHLGHLFLNEGFTPENSRHCVNSLSLEFVPQEEIEVAYLAGGCFWGVQYYLQKHPGVIFSEVGYCGLEQRAVSYQEVCRGESGFTESVRVLYRRGEQAFREVAKLFLEIHDFTQLNRQGPDLGPQYRSAIFFTSPEQRAVAEELLRQLSLQGYKPVTALEPWSFFHPAEAYHQNYYEKSAQLPYCHRRRFLFR